MSKSFILLYGLVVEVVLLCSCGGAQKNSSLPRQNSQAANPQANIQTATPPPTAREQRTLKITSTAFQEGGTIPQQYTCSGANISPPLAWEGVPDGAKTLALILDDPDAPGKTWVHWVLYNLPATTTSLPENVPAQERVAGGGVQGKNDFRNLGYGSPCPPPGGAHRYYFKLYALDTELTLDPGATKEQLLKAMEGHVLVEGELIGKYTR